MIPTLLPIDREKISVHEKLDAIPQFYSEYYANKYSIRQRLLKYGALPSTAEFEPVRLADDRFFLGFRDLNYTPDNIVAPQISIYSEEGGEIHTKPKTIVIFGEKGTGKSVLASIIAFDNIAARFGVPTLVLDPAGEYFSHREPITELLSPTYKEKTVSLLNQLDLQPRGYTMNVLKPSFDSTFKEEGVDTDLTLTYMDFKEFYAQSKMEAVSTMKAILDPSGSIASEDMIIQILARKHIECTKSDCTNPEHREIKTWNDIFGLLHKKPKIKKSLQQDDTQIESIGTDAVEDFNPRGTAFAANLRSNYLLGVLSDKSPVDIVDLMAHNDMVVLRSIMRSNVRDDPVFNKYLAYIKLALMRVIDDRKKFVFGTSQDKAKSRLNGDYGIQIVIDEADTVAPESMELYTKALIRNLATKERKAGISQVLLTQDLAQLDNTLISQADFLFTSQINTEANIKALKLRGISPEAIDYLKRMGKEQTNSLGAKVSRWACIDKNKNITYFWPSPPLSSFFMR